MSSRLSGRLISITSAHRSSPSAPISTSLKTQATHPPSVREGTRTYPTAVVPPISRRSLWHGRRPGCRGELATLCRWAEREAMRGVAGIGKLRQHVADLLGYLERNEAALVHYAARRRRGEPIATSFVESAVDEIIAWRMAKAQQMRWSKPTLPPFLDVRTAVLNGTLEDAFRRRHHGFRPTNDDQRPTAAAA